jgi:hypothetical protein
MLPFFLAVALAQAPVETVPRVSVAQPALAMVRIVRATEIRFREATSYEASLTRQTSLRERDGTLCRASLVEFY